MTDFIKTCSHVWKIKTCLFIPAGLVLCAQILLCAPSALRAEAAEHSAPAAVCGASEEYLRRETAHAEEETLSCASTAEAVSSVGEQLLLTGSGEDTFREQKYQILKAMNELRDLGFSPEDILHRIFTGTAAGSEENDSREDAAGASGTEDGAAGSGTDADPSGSAGADDGSTDSPVQDAASAGDDLSGRLQSAGDDLTESASKAGSDLRQKTQDALTEKSESITKSIQDGIRKALHDLVDSFVSQL